jgi:hypothetical protein
LWILTVLILPHDTGELMIRGVSRPILFFVGLHQVSDAKHSNNHCRTKCQDIIEALTDERAQEVCPIGKRGVSFMELLLYNMRHVQEHASQLSLILGQKYGSAPGWVGSAKD